MANLLQSSQTQATQAPGFYNDYLSNLATQGTNAAQTAQYVGAQPLQEQAFNNVASAASAYQPTLTAAGNTLASATNATSPLNAANPYLTSASGDVGRSALALMNPYTQDVVNSIGDVGQRNIMMNLAPQAVAGAVGSGQFGSTRGAAVLGQTIQNANQDILKSQREALQSGYNTALQTALQKQQLEGQLGSTAGQLASAGQQNLTQAGAQQGQLASTNQQLSLADINALATLGGQQQTIKQNQQLFPLTNLSTLSGILRGYNVPTTTQTTAEMSPLSALGAVGAGAAGMLAGTGASGTGPSYLDQLTNWYNRTFPASSTSATGGTSNSGTTDTVTALQNQGYTLNPDNGYLTKDGVNYALDANNNLVEVGTNDTNAGGSWDGEV